MFSFGFFTNAKQLTGPAGRPRMCSYKRMNVNALSQHFSFGIWRGCAAEADLLDRAACLDRDRDRDRARARAAGFRVLCPTTSSDEESSPISSSSSVTMHRQTPTHCNQRALQHRCQPLAKERYNRRRVTAPVTLPAMRLCQLQKPKMSSRESTPPHARLPTLATAAVVATAAVMATCSA